MRLDGDVEFLRTNQRRRFTQVSKRKTTDLEQPERVITALQQLPERRLVLSSYALVDGLERLDSGREGASLDNADECAVEAHAGLEERGVRSYSFASLERGSRVHRIKRIERECHDRAFCENMRIKLRGEEEHRPVRITKS